MNKEEAIEILKNFKNYKFERDKLEVNDRTGGFKIGEIYKITELDTAIETVLQALENSISKDIIKEIIEKIKRAETSASECINERIVIADSDSLNFGRKEAHNYALTLLEKILNNK